VRTKVVNLRGPALPLPPAARTSIHLKQADSSNLFFRVEREQQCAEVIPLVNPARVKQAKSKTALNSCGDFYGRVESHLGRPLQPAKRKHFSIGQRIAVAS